MSQVYVTFPFLTETRNYVLTKETFENMTSKFSGSFYNSSFWPHSKLKDVHIINATQYAFTNPSPKRNTLSFGLLYPFSVPDT